MKVLSFFFFCYPTTTSAVNSKLCRYDPLQRSSIYPSLSCLSSRSFPETCDRVESASNCFSACFSFTHHAKTQMSLSAESYCRELSKPCIPAEPAHHSSHPFTSPCHKGTSLASASSAARPSGRRWSCSATSPRTARSSRAASAARLSTPYPCWRGT